MTGVGRTLVIRDLEKKSPVVDAMTLTGQLEDLMVGGPSVTRGSGPEATGDQ